MTTDDNMKIINMMYDTIKTMAVVLNQVSDYSCPGRKEMNKSWTELANEMRKLNKPVPDLTADLVRRLREHTGEGLMACGRALVATNCDFDAAIEHLRMSGTSAASAR